MTGFRILLMLMFVALLAYTAPVVLNHGLDLFTPFFGAIRDGGWQGQFNLDFLFMLVLSGLWVAWRHRFTAAGIALGTLAFLGGAAFLSAYLLIVSVRAGRIPTILLGPGRG